MARSHAKLLSSIWADPDWLKLSESAQRAYMLVLSQPKLSLVGVVDYVPQRWARLAADGDLGRFVQAINELVSAGFVVVDESTVELCVRSFVRHDVTNTSKNSKIQQGFWRAWGLVVSPAIRRVIAVEIPDELWDSEMCEPPNDALALRAKPEDATSGVNQWNDLLEGTSGCNRRTEPPSSVLQPPALTSPNPSLPETVDPLQESLAGLTADAIGGRR